MEDKEIIAKLTLELKQALAREELAWEESKKGYNAYFKEVAAHQKTKWNGIICTCSLYIDLKKSKTKCEFCKSKDNTWRK